MSSSSGSEGAFPDPRPPVLSPLRLSATGLLALTAALGSLGLSEVWGYVPCDLCWYQRALMYPLALLSVSASLWRWQLPRAAVWTLAVPGLALSLAHSLQMWGVWRPGSVCTSGCLTVWPVWSRLLGSWAQELDRVLGVPVLSLLAFAGILALSWARRRPEPAPSHGPQ